MDMSPYPVARLQEEDMLVEAITKVIKENSLTAHKPFIDKIIQLYQLSQVNHGKFDHSRKRFLN